MKIIGLDVGEKRIGVARADFDTKIAIPVGFVEVNGLEFEQIARIARLSNTTLFVLGLPRNNSGEETKQSLYVRSFAKQLKRKIPGAKIRFQDESLTSVVAEERLKKRKKNYQKGDIDAEAASIILQDFIESVASQTTSKQSLMKLANEAIDHSSSPTHEDESRQKTKKGIKKMKQQNKEYRKHNTATKWIAVILVVIILGLFATGGILLFKKLRTDARQEEYARIEAEKKAEVFNFTILPGETLSDIKAKLLDLGYSDTEIENAFLQDYGMDFLKERPSGASLEGYLFGNTHEFYKSATVEEILFPFLKEMGKFIAGNDLKAKYEAHNLSLFEGITLASVVQKEAAPRDQSTVAQVFLLRLAYGMPLGSDVTVSYALDQIDPERQIYTDNQSSLKVDSCYNTRLYPGLPCGPISNPGASALLAVAEPSETSYLYFLTGDDGMMYYSYTESEHIQNSSHCKELCNTSL